MIKKILSKFRKKEPVKPVVKKEVVAPRQVAISPEALCKIDPTKMSKAAIRDHLALLYKRHNSAVSSIKPELRAESRQMLEAIAECRLRYVDDIA